MKIVYLFALLMSFFLPATSMADSLLVTRLFGAEEVPGPGDEDGSGLAALTLKRDQGRLCYFLSVSNIDNATAAHIHKAPFGSAGPVVVTLDAPSDGSSHKCIKDVDTQLLQDIIDNPSEYYVNVHNAEFPSGAIRGQLDPPLNQSNH